MASPSDTLKQAYFDAVYQANNDPWSFASSPYEQDKYKTTLAALPKPLYASAFEIGCSIGVLTQLLATRCQNLLSVDVSEAPLEAARKRLAGNSNVTIQQMVVPDEFPDDNFELIVLSEVGYYFSWPDLTRVRQLIIDHLQPAGQLLLVHWTPLVHDYPLTGDQVHDFFLEMTHADGPLSHLKQERSDTYRLDLLQRKE